MLDALFERARGRLRGLLQTIAVHVVKPAVITATYAVFFDPAVFQRRAAMRTMQRNQPEMSLSVTKQHELFRQQCDLYRRRLAFHRIAERHRPPVTPEHLPGRRAATDAGKEFVFFFRQHGDVPFF